MGSESPLSPKIQKKTQKKTKQTKWTISSSSFSFFTKETGCPIIFISHHIRREGHPSGIVTKSADVGWSGCIADPQKPHGRVVRDRVPFSMALIPRFSSLPSQQDA